MFTGQLFPYQEEGVREVLERCRVLVAYSMGTGKTVLTIAAMEEMFGRGEISCCLILVPSSLKWQWAASLAKFTDLPLRTVRVGGAELVVPSEDLCMVVNGTPAQRRGQWARAGGCDYVIASYSAVLDDWDLLLELPMDAMVLDEATVIKNFQAQTSKRIKRLRPPVRVALTGTPVENSGTDAFSIMEWVDAQVLGRWDLFDKSFIDRNAFGGVHRYKNLDLLNRKLSVAMIRKSRSDPDVAKYLPTVTEATRPVRLDKITREIYRAILVDLESALTELSESGESFDLAGYYAGVSSSGAGGAQGRVMARLQAARMLLDHPQLLMDSACDFHEGKGGSAYVAQFVAGRYDVPDLRRSPKLEALGDAAEAMLLEPGVKIAVFSEYRRMLPYLAERLERYGEIVFFHGGMNANMKAGAKARFQSDPGCRIFISTNAGGYGLDLPEVQYLINYDLPYSNGVLQQRNTRHVRASSQHSRVYVLNLVVQESIEERVLTTLKLRGSLADAVIDGKGSSTLQMNPETLGEHVVGTL